MQGLAVPCKEACCCLGCTCGRREMRRDVAKNEEERRCDRTYVKNGGTIVHVRARTKKTSDWKGSTMLRGSRN